MTRRILLAVLMTIAAVWSVERTVLAAPPTRPLVVVLVQGIQSSAPGCSGGTAYQPIEVDLANAGLGPIAAAITAKQARVVEFSYSGQYCGSPNNPNYTKPLYAQADTCRGVYGQTQGLPVSTQPGPGPIARGIPPPDFSSPMTDSSSATLKPSFTEPEKGAIEYLDDLITALNKESNNQYDFVFVAHSMGGLVVSAWLAERAQKDPKGPNWVQQHVRAVVSLDSMIASGIGPAITVAIGNHTWTYCTTSLVDLLFSEAVREIADDSAAGKRPIQVIKATPSLTKLTSFYHILTSQCIVNKCIGQSFSSDTKQTPTRDNMLEDDNKTLNLRHNCLPAPGTILSDLAKDLAMLSLPDGMAMLPQETLMQYSQVIGDEHGCGFKQLESRCWIYGVIAASLTNSTPGSVAACSADRLKTFSAPPASGGSRSAKGLDLAIVIDSTSSMEPYIDAVKAAAADIVSHVASSVPDYRIALIDFQDLPAYTGNPNDYAARTDVAFTKDAAAIVAGISALTLGDGGDIPESDYSALLHTMHDASVGGWRNGVDKQIILMSDAPPHDPEPITGYTLSTVTQAAKDLDPAVISVVVPGSDAAAYRMLSALSDGTGGHAYSPADASQVVSSIQEAISAAVDPLPPVLPPVDLVPPSPGSNSAAAIPITLGLGGLVLGGLVFIMLRRRQEGLVLAGPGGLQIPLRGGQHVLGRDSSCDIRIADDRMSRRHAQLVVSAQGAFVQDLGSTGGTFVNGVQVLQAPVAHGDHLRLGDTEFLVWRNGGGR